MSSSFKTIDEIETWLLSVPMFSTRGQAAANFNLDRMVRLLSNMGDPHKTFRSIHVGGTNGKGTVCRMLASVFQSAGLKTGLYTSPHLISYRERFRINSEEIDPLELISFFEMNGSYLTETEYTFFEITTAIAFWYFAKEKVDIAVIEVGLGGRLDATNVIDPILSVITSISLDHTDILGNTIDAIAFEKGGIIKNGRPVVTGVLSEESEEVIRQISEEKHSEVLGISHISPVYINDRICLKMNEKERWFIDYSGKEIDAINAAIVLTVTEKLKDSFLIDKRHFIDGIETSVLKFPKTAVFEKLSKQFGWYFDGAHNLEAVAHLVNHLKSIAPPEKWNVVLSFMRDKLTHEIAALWNEFDQIYLYEAQSERAASYTFMKTYFPHAEQIFGPMDFKSNHFESELVIFSGSFYFYEEVSKWLGTIITAR